MSDSMPCVLTIAGSDSGGGAGIQADIKSFQERDVFGTSVITAITAQNTCGVQGVYPVEAKAVQQQLQSVGEDFFISAVKTGMLFNTDTIALVANAISEYRWKNIVVDPVMVSTSGHILLEEEAIDTLKTKLFPLARIVTPNIPEAEHLTGLKIEKDIDILKAAERILSMGVKSVLIKGGHKKDEYAEDVYVDEKGVCIRFSSKRIDTKNTHGTGCTFSAVLTAELGKRNNIDEALMTSKRYIQSAIENVISLGQGHGPTNHGAYRKKGIKERIISVQETIDLFHNGDS